MPTIKQVRAALAAQVQAGTGLTAKPYMPGQVNPPMVALMYGAPYVKYGIVLGEHLQPVTGVTELNLNLLLIMSQASGYDTAQEKLDDYLDLNSPDITPIPAAIEADPTLGGLVEWCEPLAVTAPVIVPIAGVEYFSARLAVNISVQQAIQLQKF